MVHDPKLQEAVDAQAAEDAADQAEEAKQAAAEQEQAEETEDGDLFEDTEADLDESAPIETMGDAHREEQRQEDALNLGASSDDANSADPYTEADQNSADGAHDAALEGDEGPQ